MAIISILGSGHMGTALAALVEKGGHTVDQLERESTAVQGQIVILAIPYSSHDDVVQRLGAQLADRIVVDLCNPVNSATGDSLLVPDGSSAAQELADKLPRSRVLKAFNTTFAMTLSSGAVGDSGVPTTVLIAGDDADAKAALSQIVVDGGLKALDAGSLKRAHELEAIGFQQIVLAMTNQVSWAAGFAIVG